MKHQYMKFITKPILAISCILIGCADPNIGKIRSPSIKKADASIDPINQQPNVDVDSYQASTITCGEPAQLTLDNAAIEVTQYLEALQRIPFDDRIQHQAQYQPTGKRLLQQLEELKNSQKRSYRMADRNFLYTDISSEGMSLLLQQMKHHSEHLRSLRDLRKCLLQNFHFSQEELGTCKVKVKPSKDQAADYEIDSSDEEKLTYSRGELALRKGGLQGIQQGILGFPKYFLESLQSMLLDNSSTVDKMADYLMKTPHVSDKIADYMDSIEGNEEEKGKEVGEWITSQLLVGISEIYQANLIKYIGKIKLIKALLKVVRTKRKQATKLHQLTQKGSKKIGKLIAYQNQTAQEMLSLCKNNPPPPSVQHKSYWHKSLSELANLAAKGDEDAKPIVKFLKQEL
jgi:hypothetical protein